MIFREYFEDIYQMDQKNVERVTVVGPHGVCWDAPTNGISLQVDMNAAHWALHLHYSTDQGFKRVTLALGLAKIVDGEYRSPNTAGVMRYFGKSLKESSTYIDLTSLLQPFVDVPRPKTSTS